MANWQDRITEIREMKASELDVFKLNPKEHPKVQLDRLRAVLDKFGKVGILLAWHSEANEGRLTTFDGHARRELDPEQTWRVGICDITDEEARELVLYYDPLAALAILLPDRVEELHKRLSERSGILREMLDDQGAELGFKPPDFEPVGIDEQPRLDEKKKAVCPECGAEFVPS